MIILDVSNLVTYAELFQLLAIFSGIWLAILSLMGSLAAAWYIRDSNRRDRDNERRFGAMESNTRHRMETLESNVDHRMETLESNVDHRMATLESNVDRRFSEMEEIIDRRFEQAEDVNERRHQEVLRAIGLLYHHVHADGSPAIVPLPDVDPAVPAPADN